MDPAVITVIDGDTVRHSLYGSIRLKPYNTPEIHGKCPDEQRLALKAKGRLRELLGSPTATLHILKGSCAWGRRCGMITVDGKNVADILVSEGLAEHYVCKSNKCPKPKDWCAK